MPRRVVTAHGQEVREVVLLHHVQFPGLGQLGDAYSRTVCDSRNRGRSPAVNFQQALVSQVDQEHSIWTAFGSALTAAPPRRRRTGPANTPSQAKSRPASGASSAWLQSSVA